MTSKPPISEKDGRAVIRLLVEVAGSRENVPGRRRQLLEGLGRILDADVWLWVHSRGAVHGENPAVFSLIEGGWTTDDQRGLVLSSMGDRERPQPWYRPVIERLAADPRHFTIVLQDVVTTEDWHASEHYRRYYLPAGLDSNVMSTYPLDAEADAVSVIAYIRKRGKPVFATREKAILHLVASEIDWLHRAGSDAPAVPRVRELTDRERHVMTLLLIGYGRKQIASRLELSLHTVNDYVKMIHRRFGVSSRAELMSVFMSGVSARKS